MKHFLAILLACWPFSVLAQMPPVTQVTDGPQLFQALGANDPLICLAPGVYLSKATKKTVAVSVALLVGICMATGPTPVLAWAPPHGVANGSAPPTTTCPKGTLYADGCSGANIHSNFQTINAALRQSGQTWLVTPPYNEAGVDFPVGYDTSSPQVDVATAMLPSGCVYSATGSTTGAPSVICTNTAPATMDHLDFTTHGGVQLQIKGAGALAVTNSKLQLNCTNAGASFYDPILATTGANGATVSFLYDQFDGNYAAISACAAHILNFFVDNRTSGATIKHYSVTLDLPGRWDTSQGCGALDLSYNAIRDYNLDGGTTGLHGEVVEQVAGSNGPVCNSGNPFGAVIYVNNTVWYTPAQGGGPTSTENTTSFYIGAVGGNVYGTVDIELNTIVANKNNAGGPSVSVALAEGGRNSFGAVTVKNNYVDPTGQLTGMALANGSQAQTIAGSMSGNNLTFTSVGGGTINIGDTLGDQSNSTGLVPCQITSGGGLSWVCAGAPQTLSTSTFHTWATFPTTITVNAQGNGNILMTTGALFGGNYVDWVRPGGFN